MKLPHDKAISRYEGGIVCFNSFSQNILKPVSSPQCHTIPACVYLPVSLVSPSVRPVCAVVRQLVFWPGSWKPEDKVGELLLLNSCLLPQKRPKFRENSSKYSSYKESSRN